MIEPNGERVPVLIHRPSGLPHFDGNLFALTMLRMRGRAAATVEHGLRAIGLLADFQQLHQIDIRARMAAGRLFMSHEIDALPVYLHKNLLAVPESHLGNNAVVVRLQGVRRHKQSGVQSEVAATRLSYAAQYLEWRTDDVLRDLRLTPTAAARLAQTVARDIKALRVRRPVGGIPVSRRQSLTKDQKALVLELTDVANLKGPWKSEFVKHRNSLAVRWLLALGLRRGELLGVALEHLNLQASTVDIVLRPDDLSDPRRRQPNAKTRARRLELPKDLALATHDYITAWRSRIKATKKHGFLFVGQSGVPLSVDGLASTFIDIRRAAEGRLPALTAHVLRYTWNDEFSEYCDRHGVQPNDERRLREYLMGWAPDSEAAAIYTKRHIEEKARQALLKMSQRDSDQPT